MNLVKIIFFFYSLLILIVGVGCSSDKFDDKSDRPANLTAPSTDPMTMNMSLESVNSLSLIPWELTTLYSTISNSETAYIKTTNDQSFIYPLRWDNYSNIDRDPATFTVGFPIPVTNYKAIWLDYSNITSTSDGEVLVKLISQEGYQVGYLYQKIGGTIKQIFSLESLGELALKSSQDNNSFDLIYNEEYNNDVATLSIYGYNRTRQTIDLQSQSTRILAQKANIEVRRIQQLSTYEQEELLMGPWVREADTNSSSKTTLYFNIVDREIIFGQNDMLENFNWTNSTRVYNGLYLTAVNSQIAHIRHSFQIIFENNNDLTLNVAGDSIWRGRYRRMSNLEKHSSLLKVNRSQLHEDQFKGLFKSASGEEYYFTYPIFKMVKDDITYRGRYSHYTINNQEILQLHFINSTNMVVNRKSYLIDLTEQREGSRLIRLMNLTAGQLMIWGLQAYNSGNIYLEQIEISNS